MLGFANISNKCSGRIHNNIFSCHVGRRGEREGGGLDYKGCERDDSAVVDADRSLNL